MQENKKDIQKKIKKKQVEVGMKLARELNINMQSLKALQKAAGSDGKVNINTWTDQESRALEQAIKATMGVSDVTKMATKVKHWQIY